MFYLDMSRLDMSYVDIVMRRQVFVKSFFKRKLVLKNILEERNIRNRETMVQYHRCYTDELRRMWDEMGKEDE